jgi:hypothetical protein
VFSLICAICFPILRERESEEAYSGRMTKGRRPSDAWIAVCTMAARISPP